MASLSRNLSRRGLLGAVGSAALVGAGLAGCDRFSSGSPGPGPTSGGGSAAGGGTVSLMANHSADWEKQLRDNITKIKGTTPGLEVELLNISDGEQFYTKLKTQALAKTLPDVFYVRTLELTSFAKDGWIVPLDSVISANSSIAQPDDFWPAAVSQASYEGKRYGFGDDLSCYAVYINKTMFQSLGIPVPTDSWTWDDYFALAKQFKEVKGGRQTRWGGTINGGSFFLRGMLRSNGGDTFDDAGQCVVASDANVATFRTISTAVKDGGIPGPEGLPTGVDPFAAGMLGMFINGSWYAAGARTSVADKFEWDVVKLPKGSTGKREVATAGGAWALSRDAKDPTLAGTLLAKFTSSEIQAGTPYLMGASLPARKSVAEGEWTRTHEKENLPPKNLMIFKDQIANEAAQFSYPVNQAKFDTVWANAIDSLLVAADPKEGLTKIQDQTNK